MKTTEVLQGQAWIQARQDCQNRVADLLQQRIEEVQGLLLDPNTAVEVRTGLERDLRKLTDRRMNLFTFAAQQLVEAQRAREQAAERKRHKKVPVLVQILYLSLGVIASLGAGLGVLMLFGFLLLHWRFALTILLTLSVVGFFQSIGKP